MKNNDGFARYGTSDLRNYYWHLIELADRLRERVRNDGSFDSNALLHVEWRLEAVSDEIAARYLPFEGFV